MNPIDVIKVLGDIKPGDTLCSDLQIVEHSTWSSSFKRFFSGDTRETTANLIDESVESYCSENATKEYLTHQDVEMGDKACNGIKNLMETYINDQNVHGRLKASRKRLRDFIMSMPELSSSSSYSSSEKEDLDKSVESSTDEEEEEKITSDNPFDDEFDVDDLESRRPPTPTPHSSPVMQRVTDKAIIDQEHSFNKSESEEEPSAPAPRSKSKRADKFESYIKKKTNGRDCHETRSTCRSRGTVKSRKRSKSHRFMSKHRDRSESGNASSLQSRDMVSKIHVITMGDVVSKIDASPKTLPNILSSLHKSKRRDVIEKCDLNNKTWYTEHVITS